MNIIDNFQFLQPLWLLLLPPLCLLIWMYAARTRRSSMWQRICDPHLLTEMTINQKPGAGPLVSAWVLLCVLSIGVIAAAAPSWSRLSQPIMEATSARVIVFDLSRSMLVQDIKPNRYQHALAAASEIISDGFAGETGLVVFAESAFVLSPLSRDAESLLSFIEAVNPQTMPQDGSNLSSAIAASLDLLVASLSGQGQLVLISAGDSNDQGAVQLAIDAAAEGHRISVLAIGSDAGGPLLADRGGMLRDDMGQIQISKTNFGLLQRIATAGNGRLLIAGASGYEIDLLSSRIDASELVEAQRDVEQSEREAADDGVWLVWLMLPLTLVLFRRNLLWMLLLAVLLPVQQEAAASDASSIWMHAETMALKAYQRGDYDRARELSNNPLVLGASYYRSGQFAQALEQFSLDDSASALYNQANALVQLQRYPEAILSYQQAIDLDPGLSNARYNKRLLQIYLEQQAQAEAEGRDTGDGSDPGEDPSSAEGFETRVGIATEIQSNPADEQQFGSGFGASAQAGRVDPLEQFIGEDLEQDRFVLRALDVSKTPSQDSIERWISSLPESSSELYRRKFLRDFRRQQQQQR